MADIETFQHYQVLKRPDGSVWELGRGAMGVTYKAFDTNLRCNVALKVINSAYLESEMARQRFLREARAAAGLSHPNVASVFHLGESGGNYFYAMEFIDGETVEAFVRREGPLRPLLALQIALQVTRALRAASREGLVHRDIKPANLMLLRHDDEDEVHVKVIDFGLAKVAQLEGDASATITVAGFVGTPHFASPEQLEEKDLDVRSDMYSLGVSLWYMLAGRPPFSGSTVQIMSQQLTRQPPFEQLASMPPAVVHLLEHLLEKDAAKRPQTAADLRREIEQAIQALQASGAAIPPAKDAGRSTASAEPVNTSLPTSALPGNRASGDETGAAKLREPASGIVLAGRYRLLHRAGPGPAGDLFQAVELDSGRAVAIRILPLDLLVEPEQVRQAQNEVNSARTAPHPALLEVYALEQSGTSTFLAFEWVSGCSVLDLLRQRHALTLPEALQILEPLAGALDHARLHTLPAPDISPAHVLLAFAAPVDPPARTTLLGAPLATWPAFQPKVLPLSLAFGPASSPTWSGQQTIVPAAPVATGVVRQMARLTYELLGGNPGALANSAGQPWRAPLPALSEAGNGVLRAALQTGEGTAYAGAVQFVAALRAGAPARPVELSPQPAAASAAPASTPAPLGPIESRSESAFAVPSALPPSGMKSSSAVAERSGGLRFAAVAILSLIVVCVIAGVVGGLGFAAWKFLLPQPHPFAWSQLWPGERPAANAARKPPEVRRALPLETPPSSSSSAAPSLPPVARAVPFSGQALNSPIPLASAVPATSAPAPDRLARFQELLAKAQTLDRDGDAAGALDSYVTLAEDYPEQDRGLSRVDSFVSAVRAAPLATEAEQRRARQLRQPMERAAGLGSELAMLYLGDHLLASEPGTAAKWFGEAADKGEPEAMFALGNMYFNGVGVPKQPAEASRWFTLASDKGFVRAKIYLAECYEEGKGGVQRDFGKAFALLNEALGLDANNAIAMEKLAIDYERGRGTPVDARKAVALMKRAVELGDVNAMGNLGVYYMNGLGEQRKDPKMAVSLFKDGAARNNTVCMFFYARCLYDGVAGVAPNRAEAVTYYRAAAERGFPPARQWCQENKVSFVGGD